MNKKEIEECKEKYKIGTYYAHKFMYNAPSSANEWIKTINDFKKEHNLKDFNIDLDREGDFEFAGRRQYLQKELIVVIKAHKEAEKQREKYDKEMAELAKKEEYKTYLKLKRKYKK